MCLVEVEGAPKPVSFINLINRSRLVQLMWDLTWKSSRHQKRQESPEGKFLNLTDQWCHGILTLEPSSWLPYLRLRRRMRSARHFYSIWIQERKVRWVQKSCWRQVCWATSAHQHDKVHPVHKMCKIYKASWWWVRDRKDRQRYQDGDLWLHRWPLDSWAFR